MDMLTIDGIVMANGFGKDIWTLTEVQITNVVKVNFPKSLFSKAPTVPNYSSTRGSPKSPTSPP